MIDAQGFAEELYILVCIVDLYGLHGRDIAKVSLYPFSVICSSSTPVCLYLLVYSKICIMSTETRGDLDRFIIVQQHPACKASISVVFLSGRQKGRVITKCLITVHHIILIKPRRPNAYSSFEVVLY